MATVSARPVVRDGMRIAQLRGIQEELSGYRDYTPILPDPKMGRGQVLPFVKGLYFSAKIIYFIRSVLPSTLHVNWGHIIHNDQTFFSPECDIIIHKPGSTIRWNGEVLDFHFVDLADVVAVISCKSSVTSIEIDYCKKLIAFGVGKIGLVGEVCSRKALAGLRDKAKDVGYCDLWCLALENAEGRTYDENHLLEFIRFVESI